MACALTLDLAPKWRQNSHNSHATGSESMADETPPDITSARAGAQRTTPRPLHAIHFPIDRSVPV